MMKNEATMMKKDATMVKKEATMMKKDATMMKKEATMVKNEATMVKKEATLTEKETHWHLLFYIIPSRMTKCHKSDFEPILPKCLSFQAKPPYIVVPTPVK